MKFGFAFGLLAALVAVPAAALDAGDNAPDFTAQAARNGAISAYSLKQSLKQGPVVVYFFPTAYGGGCSIQAHAFAQSSDQVAAAGASIVGVSLDSIERLKDFSADPEYCAGQFPVASDADGAIARAYRLDVSERGAGQKDQRGNPVSRPRVERTTFIVTPDGKVDSVIGGLSARDNVEQALAALKKHAAAKRS